MKLRTELDWFRAALFSALGTAQVVACGGNARVNGGNPGGSVGDGAGNSGAAATSNGGADAAGSGQGGASTAGAAAAGAATAGAAAGAGEERNNYPCVSPYDLRDGFEQCGGFRHRLEVLACTSLVPRPEAVSDPLMLGTCKFDADCKDHPYGWCSSGYQLDDVHCEYGCVSDSDCASNQICECGKLVGTCVAADCTSDADCSSGFLCRSYDSSGGCGPTIYTCQSAADVCAGEADCNSGDSASAQCRFDAEAQRFQCVPGFCAIGRPFLVEGAQRLAPVTARADWSTLALLPQLIDLDTSLRVQLTERWTRVALMEHASIAAFARFTLQLLSLGAPAELIERSTAAMVDETEHAKACFALASAYAGAPLGPGPLSVERSLDESSLQEIVLNAIREGCVGETVAAIEAREAAQYACDPALRELLLRISEDETRHAQLAYRFVQWALAAAGPELERAVRREFAELAVEPQPARNALTAAEDQLLQHGAVPDALRAAIRGQAIAQVILPCSGVLFRTEARAARFAIRSA